MPKVSVIIPVYNVEQYIERCARSLFEQTLDDIEYIFVNDCTPDKSMEVLARVLDDYPTRKDQVRIIDMPVNSGQAKVRKVGIEAATGDYIIHCDSDDWVDVTMYEQMWRAAETNGNEAVICAYYVEERNESDIVHIHRAKDYLYGLVSGEETNALWNKLIRKNIVGKASVEPVFNMMEDTVLTIQYLSFCNNVGFIDNPLYHYCSNRDGICARLNEESIMNQARGNFETMLSFLRQKELDNGYKYAIRHRKCLLLKMAWSLPWKYYVNLYPEAILHFFVDNSFSFSEKMGHLTKLLGIHGISQVRRSFR